MYDESHAAVYGADDPYPREVVEFVRTAPDCFEPRTVSTAPGVGGNVEVTNGLLPGDQVVVAGSFLLKSQLLKSSLAEE